MERLDFFEIFNLKYYVIWNLIFFIINIINIWIEENGYFSVIC